MKVRPLNTHSVPFSCACQVQRWWSNVGLTFQVARRSSRRILVTRCRTNSQLRWSRSALRSPSFQDTCRETCRLPDGNIFTVSPVSVDSNSCSVVKYTFIQIAKKKLIQKHFHPKTLLSKNTVVQNHFIQKRRQFHPRHFHPKTGS